MKYLLYCALFATVFFSACKKDLSFEEQLASDTEKIQNYLTDKGLTADSITSGLHYIIEVEGSGGHPGLTSNIKVTYKGYYLDDMIFDPGGTIQFNLQEVITGWQEGIPLFQKGGKGKLLIPSYLAYGSNPPSGVRKNAPMVFDVELLDF